MLNENNDTKIVVLGNDKAQRNKGGIDTHFLYVNKQQSKACSEGEIKLLDPQSMIQCREYKSSVRSTTVIFLIELEEAQDIHD